MERGEGRGIDITSYPTIGDDPAEEATVSQAFVPLHDALTQARPMTATKAETSIEEDKGEVIEMIGQAL